MTDLLAYFKAQQDEIVQLLIQLVERESFSREKSQVDVLVDFLTGHLRRLDPSSLTRLPQSAVGDLLLAKWHEHATGKPILVLMHLDTVHPIGALRQNPIRMDDKGHLYGPGVLDMKGGIAVVLEAVRGLQALNEFPIRPIWMLFTSDEEIGSEYAAPIIEAIAPQAGLCLVMEFPTVEGALKTGRKGVAVYDLQITGYAAHAGNAPEKGVNAVLEMAYQIIAISKLQNLREGISVAVNTVQGGNAVNVIAPSATAQIDVRTLSGWDMDQLHTALTELHPKIPGASVQVSLQHRRDPMERDAQMIRTFQQSAQIAKRLGLRLHEDTVGGGSDGNITANLGVPTLDGLGPRGDGAHTQQEYVIVHSLAERAAHIAAMFRDWQMSE